jgi:hypothetical protein
MSRLTGWMTRAAVLLLLAAGAPAPARQQDQPPPQKCCFTNTGYSGVCEIQPAKDETCATILAYLNNPMAQGKNYCGNTQVRSGWKSVACERK